MKKIENFVKIKKLIEMFLVLTAVLYMCELRVTLNYANFLQILPYELKGALLPINMILGTVMLYVYYWDSKKKILKAYVFMVGICLLANVGHIITLSWVLNNDISKTSAIQCIMNICVLVCIVVVLLYLLFSVKIEMNNVKCGKTDKYTSEDNYPNKSKFLLAISSINFFMVVPFSLWPLCYWPFGIPVLMGVVLLNNKIRRGRVRSALLNYFLILMAVSGHAYRYGAKGIYSFLPIFFAIIGVSFVVYVLSVVVLSKRRSKCV